MCVCVCVCVCGAHAHASCLLRASKFPKAINKKAENKDGGDVGTYHVADAILDALVHCLIQFSSQLDEEEAVSPFHRCQQLGTETPLA